MRVLVTGAGGFLGAHTTAALLRAGHRVVMADDLSRHGRDETIAVLAADPAGDWHDLDLTAPEGWERLGGGYDAVFHFAAINGTRHFYERPYEVLDRNIELVRRLLAWHALRCPNARIIWTSSSEVYAGVPGVAIPTDEATPVGVDDVFNPRYSYAVSKIAGELLIINYARGRRARYTIVRPHNIYGPRMGVDHVIPELILRICRRETPLRLYGNATRAFCHVEDCVRGLLAVPEAEGADGEVINLGDDRLEIEIRDVAQRLCRIARWDVPIEVRPGPPGSAARRRPALEKARRLLGYFPEIDLEEGLRRTYDWYAEHGAG